MQGWLIEQSKTAVCQKEVRQLPSMHGREHLHCAGEMNLRSSGCKLHFSSPVQELLFPLCMEGNSYDGLQTFSLDSKDLSLISVFPPPPPPPMEGTGNHSSGGSSCLQSALPASPLTFWGNQQRRLQMGIIWTKHPAHNHVTVGDGRERHFTRARTIQRTSKHPF